MEVSEELARVIYVKIAAALLAFEEQYWFSFSENCVVNLFAPSWFLHRQ
jgi:hypothetical protein